VGEGGKFGSRTGIYIGCSAYDHFGNRYCLLQSRR
jgi:hypothetical protein